MKKTLIQPEIEVVRYNISENITVLDDEEKVFSQYDWDVDVDGEWN